MSLAGQRLALVAVSLVVLAMPARSAAGATRVAHHHRRTSVGTVSLSMQSGHCAVDEKRCIRFASQTRLLSSFSHGFVVRG